MDERAAVMLRLHDLLLDRMPELLDIITLENRQGPQARLRGGRARRADRSLLRADGRQAHGDRAPRRLFPLFTRIDINHVPKGVVGIISPWNYPLTMALSDGLPALHGRQRGRRQAGRPDDAHRADGREADGRGRLPA